MRSARFLLLAILLSPTACGGVEVQSDFNEGALAAPYAELALRVYEPYIVEVRGDVLEIDQPALDRFRNLVEDDLRDRGKRIAPDADQATSVLRAELVVSHSRSVHQAVRYPKTPRPLFSDERGTAEARRNQESYDRRSAGGSDDKKGMQPIKWSSGGNELWYTYVLSWHLHGIDEPVWMGTVQARAEYGGGGVIAGTDELMDLLFNGEEQ